MLTVGINKSNDRIIILPNKIFLLFPIISVIMIIIAMKEIVPMVSFTSDYSTSDVFGLVFLCVWVCVVLGLGIGACISFYKKIVIDIEGIEVCSFVRRKKIKWSELEDYGLSYSGKTKADSYMYNTYYLYFAEEPQKQKNKYKKKLQSDVIKFTVIGEDYYTVIREIIPFCKKMTSVEPFIPVDDFHWI